MSERLKDYPSNIFKSEFPDHAARAERAVTDWYQYAVNHYVRHGHEFLRHVTSQVVHNTLDAPEEVIINGLPLSFALPAKRGALLDRLKRVPASTYVSRFGGWFDSKLTNDASPVTRKAIEQVATTHIHYWLSKLPAGLKNDSNVWDHVDQNLTDWIDGSYASLHPVSQVLLSCIQAAVVEQFWTDKYAPKDLFGNTHQKSL